MGVLNKTLDHRFRMIDMKRPKVGSFSTPYEASEKMQHYHLEMEKYATHLEYQVKYLNDKLREIHDKLVNISHKLDKS